MRNPGSHGGFAVSGGFAVCLCFWFLKVLESVRTCIAVKEVTGTPCGGWFFGATAARDEVPE